MNLTQLESVETELKRKRHGQNKVLKLTDLKRRSCGHQERLKRIKEKKIWLKQGSRAFLRRNRVSKGLSARSQGLKHNYVYKPEVYNVKKDKIGTLGGKLGRTGA
jgi:hypothetical protein